AFLSSAQAAPFDGSWSVLIVTRSGPCGESYRYGVTISNGIVQSAGIATVNGRVSANGSVSVCRSPVRKARRTAPASCRATAEAAAGAAAVRREPAPAAGAHSGGEWHGS